MWNGRLLKPAIAFLSGVAVMRLVTIALTHQMITDAKSVVRKQVSDFRDPLRDTDTRVFSPASAIRNNRTKSPLDLKPPVRVLCWIMTSPATLHYRAEVVAMTWARRCRPSLFMSSQENTTFPGKVVALNMSEGRQHLWAKTRRAFSYIYDHHINDADWFFKADDDTYLIHENLVEFLSDKDPTIPVWYGHHFVPYAKNGYMSGGAGYVLSKEAVVRLVRDGVNNRTMCYDEAAQIPEDAALGICLGKLGVLPGDSRDEQGRMRFIPLQLDYFLLQTKKTNPWFHRFSKYNVTMGKDCCSDKLITVHYVEPHEIIAYDHLLYGLNPPRNRSFPFT
ncbi:glycoprotein-N-acetylgalactosamine 3-beta-galactosyltransferase 1-like [Diadema antillarum]|uniref:glycoprotein-N-acetylgalactosamine 3-beta-galactosyltransferase 1-like n=1 Tax=Diadema antillarum TaxID=105358 RepID=UPI003A8BCA09